MIENERKKGRQERFLVHCEGLFWTDPAIFLRVTFSEHRLWRILEKKKLCAKKHRRIMMSATDNLAIFFLFLTIFVNMVEIHNIFIFVYVHIP